jgi:uncharacterized protein
VRLPFLTARWVNLINLSYAVPPALLLPHLPPGLQLDERDGQTFVSLVAFDFRDTRVLGIPWPGFRHFAELNLRFYVRHGAERGVVFIREFVPQPFVAWVARTVYNEPYLAAPLRGQVRETAHDITVAYHLTWAGQEHGVAARGSKPSVRPPASSIEHFFKEHQWGFGVTRRGQTLRYEVAHPVWDIYPVQSFSLDFDFGAVYGAEWAFLAGETPYSAVLALGSEIAVYPHGALVPQSMP